MNPDIDKSGGCRSPLAWSANGVDKLLGGLSGVSLWLARLSGALVVVTAVLVSMEVLLRKLTRISVSFTTELPGYPLAIVRSEERRGGKERFRTCRSRWSPYP